jgi:hypothetical protein
MTQSHEPVSQPNLAELFTRYLHQQVEAQAQGLGYADPSDEVVPHDSTPMQPVDPKLAWTDALAVAGLLLPGQPIKNGSVPPDWPLLVSTQEPAVGLAFAFGNFPQLVRNLQPLLAGEKLAPPAAESSPANAPGLLEWAATQARSASEGCSQQPAGPPLLLAAGVLRLARHFDRAEKLLAGPGPAGNDAARANEQAALAWHRGQAEQALELWRKQPDSVPVHFNRGMAALFLGKPREAVPELTRAVSGLPETSAWHHLGQLYLALASTRLS